MYFRKSCYLPVPSPWTCCWRVQWPFKIPLGSAPTKAPSAKPARRVAPSKPQSTKKTTRAKKVAKAPRICWLAPWSRIYLSQKVDLPFLYSQAPTGVQGRNLSSSRRMRTVREDAMKRSPSPWSSSRMAWNRLADKEKNIPDDHSQLTKRARLSRETERFRSKWQSAARVRRQSGCRKSGESGSFREYWPFPPGLADAPSTRSAESSSSDSFGSANVRKFELTLLRGLTD